MKKSILIAGAALAVFASVASAAPGLNLAWNDCIAGGTAAQNAAFACNINTGSNILVGSFFPPAVPDFVGISAQVDITTDQANLPDWWKFGGSGCRGQAGLVPNLDFTANTSCTDPYAGQAAAAYSYDSGFITPNRGRLRIQGAIPIDQALALDPATQYYGFKAVIQHTKTTGTGNCLGCEFPACLVLNEIQLFQANPQGANPSITSPATRNFATWQSPVGGPPGCPQSTPTRSQTWGQVRSLYR